MYMSNEKVVHGFVRPVTMGPETQIGGNGGAQIPLPSSVNSQPNYLAQLPPEMRAQVEAEVNRIIELKKAQFVKEAPLLNGTFERVLWLAAIGVFAVLLWEGGKWAVKSIFPPDSKKSMK